MIKKKSYSSAGPTSTKGKDQSLLNINEFKISTGDVYADHVAYDLFPFSLEKCTFNAACHSTGRSSHTLTTLIFPRSTAPVFFNAQQCTDAHPLIIPANTSINLCTREHFSACLVHIDNKGLRMILGENTADTLIANVEQLATLQIDAKQYETFAHNLEKQIDDLNENQDKLEDEDVAKHIIETLVEGLKKLRHNSNTIMAPTRAQKPSTKARHSQLLRHSMELILADNNSQVSLGELAQASSVSIRTLEYIFKNALGMSPKEYMMAIRLNKVHNALKHPNNGKKLVRQIIHHYGVVNTGRFAKEYRLFYGESPHKTLKRTRDASATQTQPAYEAVTE